MHMVISVPHTRWPAVWFCCSQRRMASGSWEQLLGVAIVCWLAYEAVRQLQSRLLLAAAGVGIMVPGYSVLDSYGVRLSGNWLSFTL
jgi:hypothetical protein